MQRPLRRATLFAPASLLATLLLVGCLVDFSGPGGEIGYFAFAPAFPEAATAVVEVDSVHVVLRRTSNSEVALDTAFAVTPSDTVDLSLRVVLNEPSETFWLELDCFDPVGNLVFSAGPLEVIATSSSGEVEAQDIEVEYVGVGHDAAAVAIDLAEPLYVDMGETFTLQAQALNSSGAPIPGTPIKWISEDTDRVAVPDPGVGQMTAGVERGWVHAIAQLLTGQRDTADVYVEPVPSEITIFSGDNQTGVVGTELPVVLEAQVNAPDGPVEGSMVEFTTQDGGSFGQASMATDADGYAWTTWTLGPGAGQQTATATVRNYPDLQATFTATVVAPSGTIYWVNPVDGNWSNASNWNTGRIPADTDVVAIEVDGTYTVTLDVTSSISGLVVGGALGIQTLLFSDTLVLTGDGTVGENGVMVLDGGAYNGGGQLSVSGELRWQGVSGVINSTFGAGTTRIEPAGIFSLGGNIHRFWGGHTIENFGSTSWIDGRVDASEGATFINRAGGTVEAVGSLPFQLIPGGSEPRFVNEGTFIRNGEFTVKMQVPFDNDGLVEVQSGYLALTAGGTGTGSFVSQANLNFGEPGGDPYTLTASSTVAGSGTVTFAGLAGFTAPHVVSGTYAVTGLTWINDSRVAFSADTSTTRTLLLRGDIEGTGTLVVSDTLTWDRGAMTEAGSVDVATGGTMIIQPGMGEKAISGGRIVRNYGTAIWTGEDVTIADGSVFRNEPGGTFEAQADYSFLSGTGSGTFVNAGTFTKYVGADTVTFGIQFTNQGKMDVRSGTVLLNGGGSFTDTVYIALGAVLDLAGSHTLTDGLYVSDTSSMWAPGTLRISGDASTSGRDTVVTSVDITGSLHVAADTFVFTGVQARGSASGSVTIASDAVLEFYYAEFSFAPSSTIEGPGTLLAKRSGVDVAGSYSVGLTDISALSQGGMVNFNADSSTTADLIIRDGGERAGTGLLVVTDTFDFGLGDLDGPSVTRIAPTGVLTMAPGRLNTISGGHRLQNEGVINVASGGLRLRNGGRIYNQAGGVFDIQADDFAVSWEGFNNYINNSGTVRKSAGTGTSSISAAVLFSNDAGGVVDVQSGTLSIGDFTGYAGSRVQGTGTLELGTVRLFEGDANPGTSPGVLNITGDLPQGTSSTLNIELNGPNVGTEHDQLNISGLATLNGTLNVTTSFAPTLGQTFTVLTFGSREGNFSEISGLNLGNGLVLDTAWTGTSLSLVVTETQAPWATVSGGNSYSCALTQDGAGYCWGYNGNAQFGDGSTTSSSIPTAVSGGLTFQSIEAGSLHTCGITVSGETYCWGYNDQGQLGDGTTADSYVPVRGAVGMSFVSISLGSHHTCGLTTDGTAYCWGDNARGQLGDGTNISSTAPVVVQSEFPFQSIDAEYNTTCAVTTVPDVWCWGDNRWSQLGNGTVNTISYTPQAVVGALPLESANTGTHTCGVTVDGAAYCWGLNANGELGDGTETNSTEPVAVLGGHSFAPNVESGDYHTCGVTTDGAAYCWGRFGYLGDGTSSSSSTPVAVVGGYTFQSVSLGLYHSCGVTLDGAIYCWGDNDYGELGNGTITRSTVPVRVIEP